MSSAIGSSRRFSWGVGVLAAAAAPVLVFGATAGAETTMGQVTLKQSNPRVGCAYEVNSGDLYRMSAGYLEGAAYSGSAWVVTFFDNGNTIGVGRIGDTPTGSPAKVSWRPDTAGQHVLTATLDTGAAPIPLESLTVEVRAGAGTGSFGCAPSISG